MKVEFSDEVLASMWESIDWKKSKAKLEDLQRRLTMAAQKKDFVKVEELQKKLVRDIDIKCLAVRHVVRSSSGPGVDKVRWTTSAQMMKAALSLTSKNYHASPLKQIVIVAKNNGKERRPQIPTFYDRSMGVLYSYSLIPVTEALADRKSFAFRYARSVHDAHEYILEALNGDDAPAYVLTGDIKSYYSSIQHSWLLKHVPMDKKVLSEFLKSGFVYAGELFPAEDTGISEGSNLSPFLGNFVLDGLQKHIFKALYGDLKSYDYQNGNLIRYADDILVTARSRDEAEKILKTVMDFLNERGLILSPDKTRICKVEDGFSFLAREYIKRNGLVYSYPSESAVERFIEELRTTVTQNKKSQRELILLLNRKLTGWANYYKFCDAHEAFRLVEAGLQTALLEETIRKHPKMQLAKIKAKYWYEEADGRHSFALPDDKSVRVIHITDTLLATHKKVWTKINPFLDRDYVEKRAHNRQIQNVTGKYKAIWKRQDGVCYYCGRPILLDEPKEVVPLDLSKRPTLLNQAYIHRLCLPNEFEVVKTMEDIDVLRPYDIKNILNSISEKEKKYASETGMNFGCLSRTKSKITPKWKYYKLKLYFSECCRIYLTLTFEEIEDIIQDKLPASARKASEWWYPRKQTNRIAEAWISEGYSLVRIDIGKEKVRFKREIEGKEHLKIPEVLLESKIPMDAVFELETHMSYILDKYGLEKSRGRKSE